MKELTELVMEKSPEYVCLQKVRLNEGRERMEIEGYRQLFEGCDCASWSGVTLFVREDTEARTEWKTEPGSVGISGIGPTRIPTPELSREGHLQVYDCGCFYLLNTYVPFANKSLAGAEGFRISWDQRFRQLAAALSIRKPIVICGDLNVVHTEADTCEVRLEQQRPNFTKWERDNFNLLLKDGRLLDAFRILHGNVRAVTYFGNYRATGIGNRIDYFLISDSLLPRLVTSDILTCFGTRQSLPITLELRMD